MLNKEGKTTFWTAHMNSERKTLLKFGIPTIVVSIIIAYCSYTSINIKGNDEWSNNATLIAEIGVGIVIALLVSMITKVSESRIETKISDVLNIVKEREMIRKEKEKQVYNSILSAFNEIQNEILTVLDASKLFRKSKDYTEKKMHKDQIILSCNRIKQRAEITLNDPDKISLEFFDLDSCKTIKTILSVCKNKPEFSNDGKTVNVLFCDNLKNLIEARISELNTKIGKETHSENIKLEKNTKKMLISADRNIYPLNSTMHIRAKLASVIKNKKIIFEIFNSKRRLLLSRTIDPEKNEHPELVGTNIFQADFKMDGDEWNIGDAYVVRATHGFLYVENLFTIDQRIPIIQSDKPTYTIGSDMILTVIDPDADKDNQIAEFVGDKDDSKVIIESKYGKIDGYRLKETGDSTGIFQGVIGILGIRNNGTVISQNFNGKIIDKIQGTGIVDGFIGGKRGDDGFIGGKRGDDGFIGGKRGDEITISYKNSTNVVYHSIFISNFGAIVKMDQEKYHPTDKVYITIVAPDCSIDPEKINEIGQNPENMIQIRTGIDKLNNYKLIETGTDTGIFTGELQLVPIDKTLQKQFKSKNSIDGVLSCNKEDFLEIIFTLYEDEPIVKKAIIRS